MTVSGSTEEDQQEPEAGPSPRAVPRPPFRRKSAAHGLELPHRQAPAQLHAEVTVRSRLQPRAEPRALGPARPAHPQLCLRAGLALWLPVGPAEALRAALSQRLLASPSSSPSRFPGMVRQSRCPLTPVSHSILPPIFHDACSQPCLLFPSYSLPITGNKSETAPWSPRPYMLHPVVLYPIALASQAVSVGTTSSLALRARLLSGAAPAPQFSLLSPSLSRFPVCARTH